jgi:hypothetical protein
MNGKSYQKAENTVTLRLQHKKHQKAEILASTIFSFCRSCQRQLSRVGTSKLARPVFCRRHTPSQLITNVLLPTILFLVLSSDYPEERRFFFQKIASAFLPREHPKNIVDGYNASGCLLACRRVLLNQPHTGIQY